MTVRAARRAALPACQLNELPGEGWQASEGSRVVLTSLTRRLGAVPTAALKGEGSVDRRCGSPAGNAPVPWRRSGPSRSAAGGKGQAIPESRVKNRSRRERRAALPTHHCRTAAEARAGRLPQEAGWFYRSRSPLPERLRRVRRTHEHCDNAALNYRMLVCQAKLHAR